MAAGGAAVLRQEREELPVDQSQEGLVARGPHAVPRPVERVGHGRTQHVVKVDLGPLENRESKNYLYSRLFTMTRNPRS